MPSGSGGTTSRFSVFAGGIVGQLRGGAVIDCSNAASVTATVDSEPYAGGIVGNAQGGTIERCSNEGTIVSKDLKDAVTTGKIYAAGIVGGPDPLYATVKNCYNTGEIKFDKTAYMINGAAFAISDTFDSCYNIGPLYDYRGNILSYSLFHGVYATIAATNSYHLYDQTLDGEKTDSAKTTEEFASGEVTYLLNGSKDAPSGPWYQTLGQDPYPVLDPTHAAVYKVGDQYVNLTCERVAVNSQTLDYQKTLAALLNSLPKTANAFYEGSYAKQMPVTWDVNSCTYDPSTEEEQTFTVKGTVHVTGMLNGGDKPIEMQVTVKAPRVNSFMTTARPQLGYSDGGSLNLSGLRVVATMESGTTRVLEYDTEGVTFALGGQPIENGAALTKAQHNGKELKFIYDNKSTILGNLAVRSTNNAISQLTVHGIEVPYGNGGYAIALDPGSSLPSESDIQVTLGDATAQMTEKKQVDSGDREAQWEISVQAENGDVATYPLTVTVYENYKAINDQTLAEFMTSWNALDVNGITWNATQAQVQRTGDDAMGMSHQEQLAQWIITHLMEAGLALPEGKGAPSVAFDGDITWATAGDRQDHGGTEGRFAFTLTYTANAGDDETQHSSFTSNSFTGAIIPTGYDVPSYTVNFNSQGGSAVSLSLIHI